MEPPANPFPGMNPFLQQHWSDVHTALIGFIREALSDELPADLSARAEEHVAVAGGERPQGYRADVAVVESWREGFPPLWRPEESEAGAIEVAEPLVFIEEPPVQRRVEIRDVHGRLITVIEVLSPANKREDGWMAYRTRQQEFLSGGVNLVEIDLVRGGNHVAAIGLDHLGRPAGTWHLVCATRPMPGLLRHEVYLCPLREPLPAIRVPLRRTDQDVPLALQPLIDRCYRSGRYWLADHSHNPEPPVAEDDLPWIEERLRAAGLRQMP
jgi:hypothetical protein